MTAALGQAFLRTGKTTSEGCYRVENSKWGVINWVWWSEWSIAYYVRDTDALI